MQPVGSTGYDVPIFQHCHERKPPEQHPLWASSVHVRRLLYLWNLKYAALNIINYYHFHLFAAG